MIVTTRVHEVVVNHAQRETLLWFEEKSKLGTVCAVLTPESFESLYTQLHAIAVLQQSPEKESSE